MTYKIYRGFSEFTLELDGQRIIVTPQTAKRLACELEEQIHTYEREHGRIFLHERRKTMKQSLAKNLFPGRKASKHLYIANPRKKKTD